MEADKIKLPEGWTVVHEQALAARTPQLFTHTDLHLSNTSLQYLKKSFPRGIYRHQKRAISTYSASDVCLATPAASGKSAAFYVAAIETLVKDESARILAIYPLKALGREQEERWRTALRSAGLDVAVGRVDGQVPVPQRPEIVGKSRVVVATPDILHAWLLSNLASAPVQMFLRRLALIVVDEVHAYTGVFGSNAAFLFRRIQHLARLFGQNLRFICASATIANPSGHLKKLLGREFIVIGEEHDTSPRYEITVKMLVPPRSRDLLTEVSELLESVAAASNNRFIGFVDSRKQTELISSILARRAEAEEGEEQGLGRDHLRKLGVLPYRAGYEEADRTAIQDRLSGGDLRGVISTSALELGIDVGTLRTGVLVGVPHSTTSLQQRIGRIGRSSPGEVLVINCGDVYDEALFTKPDELLKRPLAEGALYLENRRIQYIHALCLAGHGGEHDQVFSVGKGKQEPSSVFDSPIDWPSGFAELCTAERVGEVPLDLQQMKLEAGDDPNHTYPLRDVERQFKVELKAGPIREPLGSLSYAQLLREAYPGAVYYYTTRAYRVYRVYMHDKMVQVRQEKKYTTSPQMLPTLVFPNLSADNVYSAKKFGEMFLAECNVQIRECLSGFKERRGPSEFLVPYPLDPALGMYFDLPRFTRNYFTSGVIITHPSLAREKLNSERLAELLYEAFLIVVPFERADVSFAADKYRAERGPLHQGSDFLAFYDRTYGSLRLTGRLMEVDILGAVLRKARELADIEGRTQVEADLVEVLDELNGSWQISEESVQLEAAASGVSETRVILPGSRGIAIKHNNAEFLVDAVFVHPEMGLCYRGKYSDLAKPGTVIVPISHVVEIPGESRFGRYDHQTGEIAEEH